VNTVMNVRVPYNTGISSWVAAQLAAPWVSEWVSEEFIQLGWCPVNVNTLPPKLGSLQMALKTKRRLTRKRLLRFWLRFRNLLKPSP
jgi:hypothetical protein